VFYTLLGKNENFVWPESKLLNLLRLVDKLLICTYDFSGQEKNMKPVSPEYWFKENIEVLYSAIPAEEVALKNKIMGGIPFYGY